MALPRLGRQDRSPTVGHRALVTGWFSFAEVVATVGDRLGAEVTAGWLRKAGWCCDVAVASYMGEGVAWDVVEPADYDLVVFTTGPLIDSPLIHRLLDRFAHCATWAVNVSVLDVATARRFDRIWPRDADDGTRTDVAFGAELQHRTPVVSVAYAPPQPEYPSGRHAQVQQIVRAWLHDRRLPVIPLEMDMYAEHRYPRDPDQIAALVARSDVVVSMRLHGAVLALRSGRPVIAIDPVLGGGKVTRQMKRLGWPQLLAPDGLGAQSLDRALDWCGSELARKQVAVTRQRALQDVAELAEQVGAATRSGLGRAGVALE